MGPSLHARLRPAFRVGCWLVVMAALVAIDSWFQTAPDAEPRSTLRLVVTLVVMFALSVALTGAVTEVAFRWVVPARCYWCGGPMSYRTVETVVYRCRRCGKQEDSGYRPTTGGDVSWPDSSAGGGGG